VPRNVVTVDPRFFPPLPSRRREQRRILAEVAERHRPTPNRRPGKWLSLDFSKQADPSEARRQVTSCLDEINPDWQRYVKVYPREDQAS
jgi:hypothetical protein